MVFGWFWRLQPSSTIRVVIGSVLFLLLGGQTVLAGFYFGLVNLVAERRASRRTSVPEAAANGADATKRRKRMTDTCAEEMVPAKPANLASEKRGATTFLGRFWGELTVVVLAVMLWLPRLTGPIDLRWDAGVYYVLGTSLATGHGYRILSEPGAPEALQYPPLLPAIVALHEEVMGSTDPLVVAPWLRKSYAVLYLIYSLAVLALSGKEVSILGLRGHSCGIVFAPSQRDLSFRPSFCGMPFALVTVVFTLMAVDGSSRVRLWPREVVSFVLATLGFLLRTAGLALFAAWVLEAVVRRRWWLAVTRGLLVLIPVFFGRRTLRKCVGATVTHIRLMNISGRHTNITT